MLTRDEQVGAQSTSMAQHLAKKFPTLRLMVQIDHTRSSSLHLDNLRPNEAIGMLSRDGTAQFESDSSSSSDSRPNSANGRITVIYHAAGMAQPVTHAAVYILHLPVIFRNSPAGGNGLSIAKAELEEYLGILRGSGGILLILTASLLPEPGSLSDPRLEAVARARDLSKLQLANEGEMELGELLGVIETVRDGLGKLAITNQLRSHNGLVVGLTIQHKAYC